MSRFWSGRRVLLTGHTGFKGAWLSLWLERLGAEVHGVGLKPATVPSLFALLGGRGLTSSTMLDIRDRAALGTAVAAVRPHVAIHLAAQAFVRDSYRDPVGTFETNVTGTVNLLDALRAEQELEAVVVATTDKVYENDDTGRPFMETDRLGGRDPYSASKACTELAVASMRASFFAGGPPIATARAGNVIGGGDWSPDRIVPDLIRARAAGKPLVLRYPQAVRPWQHVLEPLAGYLTYAEALARKIVDAPALNFGPDPTQVAPVSRLIDALSGGLGVERAWIAAEGVQPHEAAHLALDSTAARQGLGWRPRLGWHETVGWTGEWYKAQEAGGDAAVLCLAQIDRYEQLSVGNE